MAFSGESDFANRLSRLWQGRKSNSTPNPYKIIVILITRAKVMVLWSFTKNQSKIFFESLNSDHINCSSYFSYQVQRLRSGGKKFQVKTSTVATKTKIQNLNARFGHYSNTIHYYKWHYSCAATLFTTLHRNTQEWKQALNLTQH